MAGGYSGETVRPFLSVPCTTCGAQPGAGCTAPSGLPTYPHKARIHALPKDQPRKGKTP